MTEDLLLPDDDQDLVLARRIGARLEGGVAADEKVDAFYMALVALRDVELAATEDVRRQRAWTALYKRLIEAPSPRSPLRAVKAPLRLLRRTTTLRWAAVAASVLIIISVGWFLRPVAPALLASAGDTAFTYTSADGSEVVLRPHSKLFALSSKDHEVHVRLQGEAFFDVTHNPNRTFSVEANNGRISVLGTRFNVSTWGRSTTVYLEKGKVRFENIDTGKAVFLAPGEQSSLSARGNLQPPKATAGEEYVDWIGNEMIFTKRPLDLILAEMSQQYGITFDVSSDVRTETLTGRILLGDVDQAIRDLGAVLGGRFVKMGADVYRFIQSP